MTCRWKREARCVEQEKKPSLKNSRRDGVGENREQVLKREP